MAARSRIEQHLIPLAGEDCLFRGVRRHLQHRVVQRRGQFVAGTSAATVETVAERRDRLVVTSHELSGFPMGNFENCGPEVVVQRATEEVGSLDRQETLPPGIAQGCSSTTPDVNA